MAMLAGAVNVAPDDGLVSETVGGWFVVPPTVTVTGAEVIVAPSLSVATAVKE
jgi:hypothetical protein